MDRLEIICVRATGRSKSLLSYKMNQISKNDCVFDVINTSRFGCSVARTHVQ